MRWLQPLGGLRERVVVPLTPLSDIRSSRISHQNPLRECRNTRANKKAVPPQQRTKPLPSGVLRPSEETETTPVRSDLEPGNMASSLYAEHLTERQLQSLTEYKNRGEDRSITYKYVMGPLYSRLIHLVPMWVAPNTVTFTGFLLTVSGHALLMGYAPKLDEPAPNWVYLYAGLALFVYMVLDNLDGKQARRTNSSSPLGHLFDHGCDALNVTLSGMSLLATVQLGAGWMSMTLLSSLGHLMLFAATLEEYFTGAMVLRELNGPNEGIIAMSLLQILTAFLGPSVWTMSVPLPASGGLRMSVSHVIYYLGVFPTLNAVLGNATGILQFLRADGQSWRSAFSTLASHSLPVVVFLSCFNGWALMAPDSFRQQLLYILWMSGLVMFDLISRMILAHLAKAPYPFAPKLFVPVVICSVNAVLDAQLGVSFVDVEQATLATFVLVLSYNAWRIWCLIAQLCLFLNVRCFSLRELSNPGPWRAR